MIIIISCFIVIIIVIIIIIIINISIITIVSINRCVYVYIYIYIWPRRLRARDVWRGWPPPTLTKNGPYTINTMLHYTVI